MNDWFFYFYNTAMAVSLLVSLVLLIFTWRRRQALGAKAMVGLAFGTFIWTLGYTLETHCSTLEGQLLFASIGHFGTISVPVAWFVFSVNFVFGKRIISGWKAVLLGILPVIFIVLIWTNNYHHLMWYDEYLSPSGPFIVTKKTYGSWFWIMVAWDYILVTAGSVLLLRRLFVGSPLYTKQAVSLIFAVILPLLWNIFYIFELTDLPRKDLTPVAYAVSCAAITFGIIRFQLLQEVPNIRKFLIQHLNEGVLAIDDQNHVMEVNQAVFDIFSVDGKIIGEKIESVVPLLPVYEKLIENNTEYSELSLVVKGELRIYEMHITPMYNRQHRGTGNLILLHDITSRKQQEVEYKAITQTTGDGFWINDMEGNLIDVNNAYCQMTGYGRSELLKMRISDIEGNETPDEIQTHIQKVRKSEEVRFETKHRRKDGELIDVEISANYLNIGGERTFVFIRDVTQRNKMQEQLIIQDRLASIGELTAGVAHELNNPMAIIKGIIELTLEENLPGAVINDLKIANDEIDRASTTIENLLSFSRGQTNRKTWFNINALIEKTLDLRRYEQRLNNILVETSLDQNLPEFYGDESQIRQVLVNIIINAEYFIDKKRKEGRIHITTARNNGFLRLVIEDNGPGISEKDIKRIFDPFFTSKSVGEGTGLGLSICYRIIKDHNGEIEVESVPGERTRFTIRLPVPKNTSIPVN
ncbi:MAG: PAS domain S-box protein [Dehalococcoidales bacterium]|nr:PAS domain S-box protein [Dehalococcoidales bacterium]